MDGRLRVNLSIICRIDLGGEYLQVRTSEDPLMYGSVGGLARCTKEVREILSHRVGARFLSRDHPCDLMLSIPEKEKKLSRLHKWLECRRYREYSPKRLIREQVLEPLRTQGVYSYAFDGSDTSIAECRILGTTDHETVHLIFDVYNIILHDDLVGRIQREMQNPSEDPPRFRIYDAGFIDRRTFRPSLLPSEFDVTRFAYPFKNDRDT